MVHKDPSNIDAKAEIKQVEFNTIASSFGGLSAKVSALHQYVSTHLLPSAILMITTVTFSLSPPIQLLLQHSYLVPHYRPIHQLRQYLAASLLPTKRMAARKPTPHCHFAPSSSFKIPKITHLINTPWLPVFSQITTSSSSAFPSPPYCPVQVYHPTYHLDL